MGGGEIKRAGKADAEFLKELQRLKELDARQLIGKPTEEKTAARALAGAVPLRPWQRCVIIEEPSVRFVTRFARNAEEIAKKGLFWIEFLAITNSDEGEEVPPEFFLLKECQQELPFLVELRKKEADERLKNGLP